MITEPETLPLSPRDLRTALGAFATGVTVVTTCTPAGIPVGLTVNSFSSVSLQPPLVLWSLSVHSLALPAFQACTHFAVNVLTAEQKDVAQRFAHRGVDCWDGVAWRPGAGAAPLLAHTAACFECRVRTRHAEGDHVILIGAVLRCAHSRGAVPLLFHGGRYHAYADMHHDPGHRA